jgi:hypothetical protein
MRNYVAEQLGQLRGELAAKIVVPDGKGGATTEVVVTASGAAPMLGLP